MRAKHAQLVVINAGCGAVARIDSRQVVFSSPAGGATVGTVSDVAVEPSGWRLYRHLLRTGQIA